MRALILLYLSLFCISSFSWGQTWPAYKSTQINGPDSQQVALPAGWSIISSYIDPSEPMLDSVFAPVSGNVILVKDYHGNVYWPLFNLNQIGNWNFTEGYQIKCMLPDTFTVYGSRVLPATPVFVEPGWSMIAYLLDYPDNIEDRLAMLSPNLIIAKNGQGQVYWPQYSVNIIGLMIPGQGYQIKMSDSDSLVYCLNTPPNAVNDYASLLAGESISIYPLANDTDAEGNIDTAATQFSNPTNGSISYNPNTGELIYTATNHSGQESIEQTIFDTNGESANATIYLNVQANPALLILNPDTITTTYPSNGPGSIQINPSLNDSVPEGINLIELLGQANNGITSIDSTGTVEFTPTTTGLDSILYKITDNAGQSDSTYLYLEVNAGTIPNLGTTIIMRDAAMDTTLTNGLSTFRYKLPGASQFTEVTSTNGIFNLDTTQLIPGTTYLLDASHTGDLETSYGYPSLWLFLKRSGDLEAFEQKTTFDPDAPVTIQTNDTLFVYKLMNDFPYSDLSTYASYLTGSGNPGIRKFSTADANAPVWVDTNTGSPLSTTEEQWLNEIRADFASVPHVYLTLPDTQSTTQPTNPHLKIQKHPSNITASNGTNFNSTTNEIIQSTANYPLNNSEYTFKIEILQAIGDLNDVVGNPNICNPESQGYTLNTTGRRIFSVMYLAQPGTKF